MSILHAIIYRMLMKGRTFYDPKQPKDYVAIRQQEKDSVRKLKLPSRVCLEEISLGNIPAEKLSRDTNPMEKAVFYIHGGGFVTGSPFDRRSFTSYIADQMELNVYAVDYQLAPEHPFPAWAKDCLMAYRALIEQIKPENILLIGESAGGNLVLSLLQQIKSANLPYPCASFVLSPTVEYDKSLESWQTNQKTDCMVTNLREEVLQNPFAAPYYGDYTGCTPVYLYASTSEVLLDDSRILFEKLKEQNVVTRLYLRKNMMHTWIIIPFFPESKKDLKVLERDMKLALNNKLNTKTCFISLK